MYASYGAIWRARGDHFPLTTPRQPLRSFYIAERAARARAFWLSLLVFALSHCVSLSRRVSSLPALAFCSRLCRRSAFVSAGAISQRFVSVGSLDSALVSALLLSHLCLGYTSRSSRGLHTILLFRSTQYSCTTEILSMNSAKPHTRQSVPRAKHLVIVWHTVSFIHPWLFVHPMYPSPSLEFFHVTRIVIVYCS